MDIYPSDTVIVMRLGDSITPTAFQSINAFITGQPSKLRASWNQESLILAHENLPLLLSAVLTLGNHGVRATSITTEKGSIILDRK